MDTAYKYLAAYIPLLCFLAAAVGQILLAPRPLMERHRWGIHATISGVMGYTTWVAWDVTHDWVNVIAAIIITIAVNIAAYRELTRVR